MSESDWIFFSFIKSVLRLIILHFRKKTILHRKLYERIWLRVNLEKYPMCNKVVISNMIIETQKGHNSNKKAVSKNTFFLPSLHMLGKQYSTVFQDIVVGFFKTTFFWKLWLYMLNDYYCYYNNNSCTIFQGSPFLTFFLQLCKYGEFFSVILIKNVNNNGYSSRK